MPRGDGTGPRGTGPTGRGGCMGFGRGFGFGRGMRGGWGRCFGLIGNNVNTDSLEEQATYCATRRNRTEKPSNR